MFFKFLLVTLPALTSAITLRGNGQSFAKNKVVCGNSDVKDAEILAIEYLFESSERYAAITAGLGSQEKFDVMIEIIGMKLVSCFLLENERIKIKQSCSILQHTVEKQMFINQRDRNYIYHRSWRFAEMKYGSSDQRPLQGVLLHHSESGAGSDNDSDDDERRSRSSDNFMYSSSSSDNDDNFTHSILSDAVLEEIFDDVTRWDRLKNEPVFDENTVLHYVITYALKKYHEYLEYCAQGKIDQAIELRKLVIAQLRLLEEDSEISSFKHVGYFYNTFLIVDRLYQDPLNDRHGIGRQAIDFMQLYQAILFFFNNYQQYNVQRKLPPLCLLKTIFARIHSRDSLDHALYMDALEDHDHGHYQRTHAMISHLFNDWNQFEDTYSRSPSQMLHTFLIDRVFQAMAPIWTYKISMDHLRDQCDTLENFFPPPAGEPEGYYYQQAEKICKMYPRRDNVSARLHQLLSTYDHDGSVANAVVRDCNENYENCVQQEIEGGTDSSISITNDNSNDDDCGTILAYDGTSYFDQELTTDDFLRALCNGSGSLEEPEVDLLLRDVMTAPSNSSQGSHDDLRTYLSQIKIYFKGSMIHRACTISWKPQSAQSALSIFKVLLDLRFGEDPNSYDSYGRSALHIAVAYNVHLAGINALLKAGADKNALTSDHCQILGDYYPRTSVLHLALQLSNDAVVMTLLGKTGPEPINLSFQNDRLQNALHVALKNKSRDVIIKQLITQGMDQGILQQRDNHEMLPLALAIRKRRTVEVLEYFLSNGAHPTDVSGPIHRQQTAYDHVLKIRNASYQSSVLALFASHMAGCAHCQGRIKLNQENHQLF